MKSLVSKMRGLVGLSLAASGLCTFHAFELLSSRSTADRAFDAAAGWFGATSPAFYFVLAFAIPTASLIACLALARRNVFAPLAELARDMAEFIHGRYSFQIAEHKQDEIGDLRRAFDAVAQRSINAMDEMKRRDQAKSDFLNLASHELRTPLASIKGSLGLLASGAMGPIEESSLRLVQIAEIETDRMIRMISDMLDLAKIESGRSPLEADWHSLRSEIAAAAESLHGFAAASDVKLKIEKVPEELAESEVFVNKDSLKQTLVNLVSNAIKFSPRGAEVSIAAGFRDADQAIVVRVVDRGPGIKPEHSERIFQKFGRSESAIEGLVKGSGLGLAIAKALTERNGGEIGVDSDGKHGSTFWFTLPKHKKNDSRREIGLMNKNFEDALRELRQGYLKSLPEKAAAIADSLASGDARGLKSAFHNLKGTGKTFGVPTASKIGSTLENLCGPPATLDHARFEQAVREGIALLLALSESEISGRDFALEASPNWKRLCELAGRSAGA